MGELPLVSIIITNYNREKTIAKAIDSALAQTYSNLEIIISDNCSTDNSHAVISGYIDDHRIRYFRNVRNVGMNQNFKISIGERAKGEYFTTVNSDDFLVNNNFISDAVGLITKYENIKLVKPASIFYKNGISKINNYPIRREFYKGIDFIENYRFEDEFGWAGFLLERKAFLLFNFFESETIAMDFIINLNVLTKGNLAYLKTPTYQFNIHSTNESNMSYSMSQVKLIFSELNELYGNIQKCKSDAELEKIKYNYEINFIASILENNYKYNRKDRGKYLKYFKSINLQALNSYLFSKRRWVHDLAFLSTGLGFWLERMNWKYGFRKYLPSKTVFKIVSLTTA